MDESQTTPAKRRRLNHACTRCRSKKVRCDSKYPKCTNCETAKVAECVTTDPRRANMLVTRGNPEDIDIGQQHQSSPHTTNSPYDPLTSRENYSMQHQHGVSPQMVQTSYRQQTRTPKSTVSADIIDSAQSHKDITTPLPLSAAFRRGDDALKRWLDLAFARLGVTMRATSHHQQPKPFSRLAKTYYKRLDARLIEKKYPIITTSFVSLVNSVFPLFVEADLNESLHEYAKLSSPSETCSIMVHLLVASIYATEVVDHSMTALECISFAFGRISLILCADSLLSVKLLILLALNLRAFGDSSAAHGMITLASSVAHGLGINRATSHGRQAREPHEIGGEAFTWWSLYCLENIICLELERPSSISSLDCTQVIPGSNRLFDDEARAAWCGLVNLCKIQGEITKQVTRLRQSEELVNPDWSEIKRDKVRTMAELDEKLLDWANRTNIDLSDAGYSSLGPASAPCVIFTALQFKQSLFLIHRNTLLLHSQVIKDEIQNSFPHARWRFRCTKGARICLETARSIVSIFDSIDELDMWGIVYSGQGLLMAIYTLAIAIFRNLTPGLVGSDLELQSRAIELFTARQQTIHEDRDDFLLKLHSYIAEHVAQRKPQSQATGQGGMVSVEDPLTVRSTDLEATRSSGNGQPVPQSGMHQNGTNSFDHDFLDIFDESFDLSGLDLTTLAWTFDLPAI